MQIDCIRDFSKVYYTRDLKLMEVPLLIVHGDNDQIVPIGASGLMSAKIVLGAALKIYKNGDHGDLHHPSG